jgi:hypothetical protein
MIQKRLISGSHPTFRIILTPINAARGAFVDAHSKQYLLHTVIRRAIIAEISHDSIY